ncbi:flagellar biosynthesis protein FlhF [Salimicrobium humidisoli]|uniref:Flagellar biosynthesis protein FlhF n=1 Tax=Salimicrobium humidisoli TaxID=2029857 RepID=A0ABX4HRN5_9BACI|nr:AAA family ATPase [Salimicrobium humidisoli]PBB05887.1 flagellar biosynthesis protein FlhF [Salimicrobium humidisoli]
MIVKKFEAETMPLAMKKVKQEMGVQAIILNSRKKKTKGIFGLFKKIRIEITAAIESGPPEAGHTVSEKDVPPRTSAGAGEQQRKETVRAPSSDPARAAKEEPETENHISAFLEHELNPEILQEIRKEENEAAPFWGRVRDHLHKGITEIPAASRPGDNKYIHLIGPTGVGKTTTAAKLAANAILDDNLSVGFITTDTYRIAAIEQLRTYARLLDIPMEVVYNLEDYRKAREEMKDKDLVIIDTAGRNYKDSSYVSELQKIIDFEEEADTILVLSMTSKFKDIESVYKRFSEVPLHSLIFTKMDESGSFGAAVSLAVKYKKSVSFVTTGQNVPDDITTLPLSELTEQLLKEIETSE